MVGEDLRRNWGNYLKVGAILLALCLWGLKVEAQFNEHLMETKDSVKILQLICKNTSKGLAGELECYRILDKR